MMEVEFREIDRNLYLTKDRPIAPQILNRCQCTIKNGCKSALHCINRSQNVQCDDTICSLGANCCNRQFQRFIKQKPVWTEEFKCQYGAGKGLRALNWIPPNTLVIEYTGEVMRSSSTDAIKRDTTNKRLGNFYTMAMVGDWLIDARYFGNESRLVNHSCDPNCVVRTLWVKGELRLGIFAKSTKGIEKGTELTYDYGLRSDCEFMQTKCLCGSKKCTGVMNGKKSIHVKFEEENDSTEPDITFRCTQQQSQGEEDDVCIYEDPNVSFFQESTDFVATGYFEFQSKYCRVFERELDDIRKASSTAIFVILPHCRNGWRQFPEQTIQYKIIGRNHEQIKVAIASLQKIRNQSVQHTKRLPRELCAKFLESLSRQQLRCIFPTSSMRAQLVQFCVSGPLDLGHKVFKKLHEFQQNTQAE